MRPLEKHIFHYGGKKFFCEEMTLGDFYLYLKSPVQAIEQKILRCNDKLPKLTKRQYMKFVSILLDSKDKKLNAVFNKEQEQEKAKQFIEDFHLYICRVAKVVNMEMSGMPLRMFWKIIEDMELIVGKKEYDPLRKSGMPDKKALKNLFG